MTPFVAKPGETIKGLGFDFVRRLATGETVSAVTATCSAPLSVVSTGSSGTIAMVDVQVAANAADGDHDVTFSVTGSAGSVRKATRTILIRAESE